jgi:hypothetical protein
MSRLLKLLGLSLAALCIGVSGSALAAQWVYIGDSQNNHSFYLDFDSLKGTGSSRMFWAREKNPYGMTTSLAKWIVDCDRRQIGVTEAIEYSSSGAVSAHYKIDPSVGGMTEFAPGTIAESYYDFICSRITPQPQPETTAVVSGYPKAFCGDRLPSDPGKYQLYPVFADYSPGTLNYIKTNLCRDAFRVRREGGETSIQVASFTTKSRAIDFAAFLRNRVGSSEVGNPTLVIR